MVTCMGDIVFWLDKRMPASQVGLVGPKALSLCTLQRLGLRVPHCFFVSTRAFQSHLDANALRPQIESLLQEAVTGPVLEKIRALIMRAPLPEEVRRQIAAAYDRLGIGSVAVRSSATAEDLPGYSFAGQYETVLGVTSLEACLDAVRRCWQGYRI